MLTLLIRKIALFFVSATIAFNFCSCSNDDDNDSTMKTSSESYTKAISALKSVDGVNGVFTVEYTGEYNLDAVMPENPDAGKNDVQTTVAIRCILDKCASVDEAVNFLEKINMYPVFADQEKKDGKKYHAYHFAIADNKGKSIVAEWVDEKLVITETKIVTNHNLAKEKKYTDNR